MTGFFVANAEYSNIRKQSHLRYQGHADRHLGIWRSRRWNACDLWGFGWWSRWRLSSINEINPAHNIGPQPGQCSSPGAARVGQPLGLEHDVAPQSTPSLSSRYLLRAINMIYKQDIIALFEALVWYNQARISMIVLQLISISHLMDRAFNH